MKRYRLTTTLSVITAALPLLFGLGFLLDPQGAPDGFGIEPWPTGNADGYFAVKGVRDITTAAIMFLLLGLGRRRILGWAVLINTVIPVGDALAVVTHGGTAATALTVHGSAAAFVALTAALLLTERPHTVKEQPQPAEPAIAGDTAPTRQDLSGGPRTKPQSYRDRGDGAAEDAGALAAPGDDSTVL